MDGDMKTYVKDLQGNEYPLQATITNENEVNGNQSLETTIYATEMNKEFIAHIQEMWRIVDHDGVEHKIIYAKRKGIGQYKPEFIESGDSDSAFFYRPTQMVTGKSNDKKLADSTQLSVDIKAEPLFFNELNNDRIYENINRSMTAIDAFTQIFANTSFDFTLSDVFSSSSWEGFGKGETKLETFKRALDHYKAEFRIAGNMIYLEKQIGRDTQFQYRHRLNSSNIEQEIDAEEMWTYGKGYADYGSGGDDEETETDTEDWENANITAEYKSPLADVLGKLHAPPVKDGRIKSVARLKEKIKQVIDESLKVSVSADVYDLTEQGYPVAQSEVGDRVFLIDERIGLDDEVRVISQTKKRDWKGRIVDLSVTFGDEKITKRHQAQLSTAAKDINDLIEGRKKLPYSVLPAAEQNAMRALQKARTELIFGESKNGVQGIIAQEKDDPNRLVWLNSAGWMISTDGGATSKVAATADGIVADVITAGVINTDQVAIHGGDGKSYTHLSGSKIEMRGTYKRTWRDDTTTHTVRTRLDKGHLRFRNDDIGHSLYYSEFGISTYVDGGGDGDESNNPSGSLVWWNRIYSEDDYRGFLMHSQAGVPALESGTNKVVINPMRDRSNKAFHFTKSSDYQDGNLMWTLFDSNGVQPRGGLRLENTTKGIVHVIDSTYSSGRDTEITAGTGRFSQLYKRKDDKYLDIIGETYLRVGMDGSGDRRVASKAIYRYGKSGSANVHITSEGTLMRSSSASKYKVNIENQFSEDKQLEHSKNILNLSPLQWNDKHEMETICKEIEQGERLSDDGFKIEKYVGLTSESVMEAGFKEHVQTNSDGEMEGIEYDRLWIHLIPIVKDQQKRIEELEAQING